MMLGISLDEAIAILLLIGLVVGPKRLPHLAVQIRDQFRRARILWKAASTKASTDAMAVWASTGLRDLDLHQLMEDDSVAPDTESFIALPPPMADPPIDGTATSSEYPDDGINPSEIADSSRVHHDVPSADGAY